MKPIQITIPSPCSQDWNKMTTIPDGKFCHNCSTQVVDFTQMSDAQVLNYLHQHSKQHVCARTFASQLNREMEEPVILKQKKWYWKLLLLPAIFFGKLSDVKAMKSPTDISSTIFSSDENKPVQGEIILQPKDSIILTIRNENRLPFVNEEVWVNGKKYITNDSGIVSIKKYKDLKQLIVSGEHTKSFVIQLSKQNKYEVVLGNKIREPFIMGKIAMPKKD